MKLENILTISAEEYCKIYGKKLEDYRVVGIHYQGSASVECFAKKIPENAEVVVAFANTNGGPGTVAHYFASGTALIPKKQIR